VSLLWGRPAARAGVESRALSFGDVFATGGDVRGYGDVAAHSSLVPLFAAHREIIDAVAGVPLRGYRRAADGTLVEMTDDPSIIRPVVGTRYTWVQQCVASLLSDGNAYGLPTGVTAGGWPDRVMWTDPADWSIDDTEPIPRYYYRGRSFAPTEIIHIPWIQRPGRWEGISPLRAFREAWEAGTSAQTVAKNWFGGGAIPSGHLKNIAQTLDAASSTAAKSLFRAAVRGRDVLVTGKDWEYSPVGVPADEQRFVEQMKLTASQVAAIYGLPPEDVGGEAANSLTYATVEGNERRRAQRVSAPWCARIEQALTAQTARPVVIKFDLDATVRATYAERVGAYAQALDSGQLVLSEVREREDMSPLTPEQWAEWAQWSAARGSVKPAPEPEPEPMAPDEGTTP
jgi:HK97 family phage portal protein